MLTRCHRFWASDNNDALERNAIQRGMSYFFPPEVMGAHIGHHKCHATFRQHSIAFRGLTALFGHMGLELIRSPSMRKSAKVIAITLRCTSSGAR